VAVTGSRVRQFRSRPCSGAPLSHQQPAGHKSAPNKLYEGAIKMTTFFTFLLLPFAADFDIMMKSLSDGIFAIALAHLTITVSICTMAVLVLHHPVNRYIAGFGFPFSRSYLRNHPVGNRSQ
jgi:hypothetical protein